jgi:predicted nucleic acid-binding protein
MAAVDSSTLIALFQGDTGPDLDILKNAITAGDVVLPPVVLAEILCDPKLPEQHRATMLALPMLDLLPNYWQRTGATRATLLKRGLRARLADALIAQSCIDHDVALITRDRDFRNFAKHCGLKLA